MDDFSRYTWIYLLCNKSDLPQRYFKFANMIKIQFSSVVKVFRTDNAMKYKEASLLNFLHQNGIVVHQSWLGTSQKNGCAECKHQHILDTTQALLVSSSCPECFEVK